MISQLGLQGSTLGTGALGLGGGAAPPATPLTIRQAAAFVSLKWLTAARVTQVGVDVTTSLSPDLRVTQVGADALIAVTPPDLRITQVEAEVTVELSPSVNATQVGVEVVMFAPPTRWGIAKAILSKAGTRQGRSWVRIRSAGEAERVGLAYMRLVWPGKSGAPLPDPTVAPTVVVVTTGGSLPPGTYVVGYAWIGPYGQTLLSPTVSVVVSVAGSRVVVSTPSMPAGALGAEIYLTAEDAVLRDTGTILAPADAAIGASIDTQPASFAPATPKRNTTKYSEDKFDYDYRENRPLSPGTVGWKIPVQTSLVVVRSGENDVATLPVALKLNNPVVTSQLPPSAGPLATFMNQVGPPAATPTTAGTMLPGDYEIGFTWTNADGLETQVSPAFGIGSLGQPVFDIVTLAAGQGGIRFSDVGMTSTSATGMPSVDQPVAAHIYVGQPDGARSTMTRVTTAPLLPGDFPFTLSAPPNPAGQHPPGTSQWPEPKLADDASARHWYDIDYVPTMDPPPTPGAPNPNYAKIENGLWRYPVGGFRDVGSGFQDQTHGLAIYDPNWRALPTAPVVTDPAVWPGSSAKLGTRLYYRHTWTQPAGVVPEDGLLWIRFNGVLDHAYVNGQEIRRRTGPAYFASWGLWVPASLLRTGKNVLAFKCHPYTAQSDLGDDPSQPMKTSYPTVKPVVGDGFFVHVEGGWNGLPTRKILTAGPLPYLSLNAKRPDGYSRQYWKDAYFTTLGGGFVRGTSRPGLMSWNPTDDDGPGFWGYFGDTHQPEFEVKAAWQSASVTPNGERDLAGVLGPAHWPPRDDGFGVDDVFVSPTFHYRIGDTDSTITVDRFSMISVGRLGGGGQIRLDTLWLTASDEWAPGASYLLTYGLRSSGTIERTVYSDTIHVEGSFPVDAEPWDKGRVVAVVNVNKPTEIIVSAASRNPTLGNLGKARMWVYWLDENGQIGGTLASDNEFLHATFGKQPATLWPYSENMFWRASYFGSGAWQTAKAIQIVMFRHQDTPTQFNEWLINVTVREAAPKQAGVFAAVLG